MNVRIGLVLSKSGGALAKMLLPFRLGGGGVLGSGRQYWSWITRGDLVRAIQHCLTSQDLSGPVNAVAPKPVTNQEFTKALGRSPESSHHCPDAGFCSAARLWRDGRCLDVGQYPRRTTEIERQRFCL